VPISPPADLRVELRTSTLPAPVACTLSEGEALLVGRDPDPSRLPPGFVPEGFRVRVVKVAAAAVSGHHALVWRSGECVEVRDLQSRNGTSLLLDAGAHASVASASSLTLELAPDDPASPRAAPVLTAPREAQWNSHEEFPAAVAREVDAWLTQNGLTVTARARTRSTPNPPGRAALPPISLVDDHVLQLVEEGAAGTIDPLRGRVIESVVAYVHAQCARLRRERAWSHDPGLVLVSPAIREAHRRVAEAAEAAYPLILLGETGTGKGTLARCYHRHSARGAQAFEQVNCAEIDKHFARTRLFGAKKGAYTGCHADVPGVVELAQRGTLFLDEVAELPLDVQGELLTFLDDQRYKRFGDETWRQGDVQVVCGTNVDLRTAAREGRFRADLWYRLAGRVVEVPPLRERREDIIAYLQGRALGEGGSRDVWEALDEDARRACLAHSWRGNFRELAAFARRLPTGVEVITGEVARGAIAEGAVELPSVARGVGPAFGWEALSAEAVAIYRAKTRLDEPARAGDLREYIEDILKPLFFARALGLTEIDAVPERPTPTFEEMARRMGCDASTIKAQLARYVEIRRSTAPER
jgi:DNA-binding NtrC family response regulator